MMFLKRLLSVVITLVILVGILPSSSVVIEVNCASEGVYEYSVVDGAAIITDCSNDASGVLAIPSTLGGYPVKSIGNSAFDYCVKITNILIADSVVTIEDYAFQDCSKLEDVIIPKNVENIGVYAFAFCNKLTNIVVDGSNKSYSVDSFGVLFNKDKTNLIQYPAGNSRTSYTIPNSVKIVGTGAFINCCNLTNITIPNSVTAIGDNAFLYCSQLLSAIIPNSVTAMGCGAFMNCFNVFNITLSNSLTTIGANAFESCYKLTSIKIPNSVTTIEHSVFKDCSRLADITIPDSVKNIGFNAFNQTAYYNNQSNWVDNVLYINNHLIEADDEINGSYFVKDSTVTIGDNAFENCDDLISIVIPNNVVNIGESAFLSCNNLVNITLPNSLFFKRSHI